MTKLLPGQGANSDPQARIAGRCLDGTDGDEDAPVECFLGHPWRSQRGQWIPVRQFLQAESLIWRRRRSGPVSDPGKTFGCWRCGLGISSPAGAAAEAGVSPAISEGQRLGSGGQSAGNGGRADSGGELHSRERPQGQGHEPDHSGEPKGAGVCGAAGTPWLTTSRERSIRGGPIHRQRRRQQHARKSSQGEAQQG